jgi:hypothetical protein
MNWSPSMMLPSVNKVTKTGTHAAQSLTIVAEPIFHELNTFFFVYDLYYDVIRIRFMELRNAHYSHHMLTTCQLNRSYTTLHLNKDNYS